MSSISKPTPQTVTELPSLTGIRAIAAIWVVLLHFGDELAALIPSISILAPFYNKGHLGVDLFFMLSGFIITHAYSTTKNWDFDTRKRFICKRFARIYPIHLATLLSLGVMVLAAHLMKKNITGNYDLDDFFYNLAMLQGIPALQESWNYPSWSVCIEFFAYIFIFPITLLALSRPQLRHFGVLISIIILTVFLITKVTNTWGPWVRFAAVSFEFFAGATLYHGIQNTPRLSKNCGVLLFPIIILITSLCFLPENLLEDKYTRISIIFLFPFLLTGLAYGKGWCNRILSSKILCYTGVISYSLYMSHALVEKLLKVVLPAHSFIDSSLFNRSLIFSVHLLLPIIVAILFYHIVEEPSRKWVINRLSKS